MSNLNVIPVSLDNTRRISVRPSGDLDADPSALDKYAERERFTERLGDDISGMNLDEFCKTFDTRMSIPKRRNDDKNIVLRILQSYSPNPTNANYPLYCKYRLIQFKPWRQQTDEDLFNHGDNEVGWVKAWKEFVESALGKVQMFNLYYQLILPKIN
jgi:hypothetical protein